MLASAVLFCLFLLGNFITTYTIISLKVNYHDGIKPTAVIYTMSSNQSDQQVSAINGDTYLIRRDVSAFRAMAGDYSTIKEFDATKSSGTIEINIYRDKNATKYASDSPGCITYSNETDRLLSYSCTQPSQLLEYKQPPTSSVPRNTPVATIAKPDTAVYTHKPYSGGVLGIRIPRFMANVPTNQFVFNINNNGEEATFNIPDGMNQTQLDASNIVTDTTSRSGTNFLITSKQFKKVYFAELQGDEDIRYKEYTLPESFSGTFDSLICQLLETTAYCYHGLSSGPPDSQNETKHHEDEKPGTIVIIDFSNKPIARQYSVSHSVPVDALYVTKAGKLYALSGEDLVAVTFQDNQAVTNTYIPKAGSVSSGDGLYFVRDNAVYKLDDERNESYLVFRSANLRIANIVGLNENIFINAYINGAGGQRIHTYKLDDEPNTSPGSRLIDILPLNFKESDDISDMSFYKDRLHIRVKVPVQKTGRASGVNTGVFEQKKKQIRALLEQKSIDTSKLTITYSY